MTVAASTPYDIRKQILSNKNLAVPYSDLFSTEYIYDNNWRGEDLFYKEK
jgi:hypothetical protein